MLKKYLCKKLFTIKPLHLLSSHRFTENISIKPENNLDNLIDQIQKEKHKRPTQSQFKPAPNSHTKRKKLIFNRDGMILNLQLVKKVLFSLTLKAPDSQSQYNNDGYVYIEIKEAVEKFDPNVKNSRYIVLGLQRLPKLTLLEPRLTIDNMSNLTKMMFMNKGKELTVEQTSDNKYNFEIKVTEEERIIISNIELNPEDVVLVKKFVNVI
jgi:hypothetical protein